MTSKTCANCGGSFKIMGGAYTKHIKKCSLVSQPSQVIQPAEPNIAMEPVELLEPVQPIQPQPVEIVNLQLPDSAELSNIEYKGMDEAQAQDPEVLELEPFHAELKGAKQTDKIAAILAEHGADISEVIILQLHKLGTKYRNYNIFSSVELAYRWFEKYANDNKYGIHSVFLPGQNVKIFFDIDIPQSSPLRIDDIGDANSGIIGAIINAFASVIGKKPEQIPHKVAKCIRDSKIGIHLRLHCFAVKNKEAYIELCNKVIKALPEQYKGFTDSDGVFNPYIDRISGISLRMPETYKLDDKDGTTHCLQDTQNLPRKESFVNNLLTSFNITPIIFNYKAPEKQEALTPSENISDDAQFQAREYMQKHYPAYADCVFDGAFFRVRSPAFCLVCDKEHNGRNNYICLGSCGSLYFKCWKDKNKRFCMRSAHIAEPIVEPVQPISLLGTSTDVYDFAKKATRGEVVIQGAELKQMLMDNFVYIKNYGQSFIVARERVGHRVYWKQLPTLNPMVKDSHITVDGKETTLNGFYNKNNLHLESMKEHIKFQPFLNVDKTPQNTLNSFSGFKFPYEKREYPIGAPDSEFPGIPEPPAIIKHWIWHITNVLCVESELVPTSWCSNLGLTLLQWFGYMIQHPEIKLWCPVHKSIEGGGKTLFYEMISEMMGKDYMTTFKSFGQLCGDFNGDMTGKLLFVLNEATNYPSHDQRETLKMLITDTSLKVNEKYEKRYDDNNYSKLVITTNNSKPIIIDHNDRRYACFKCNDKYAGNDEYFAPLIAGVNDVDQQRELFLYFANIDLSGFSISKPPYTKWRNQLINDGIAAHVSFIADHIATPENIRPINMATLYNYYKDYINRSESGYKPLGRNMFSNSLKDDLDIEPKQCRVDGVKDRYIIFNTEDLSKRLQKIGATI